jgi:biopolymer transport protein ExbD
MAVRINKGAVLGALDLTPMIDCVFNLLIFFMVVSHFVKIDEERDLKVILPEGSEAMPLTVKPKEIFVNIDQAGRYFMRGRQLTETELGETRGIRSSRSSVMNTRRTYSFSPCRRCGS